MIILGNYYKAPILRPSSVKLDRVHDWLSESVEVAGKSGNTTERMSIECLFEPYGLEAVIDAPLAFSIPGSLGVVFGR